MLHNKLWMGLVFLIAGGPFLFAQRTSLNEHWTFARLQPAETKVWQTHNQGSDWHSQFSVQHVGDASATSALALSDSLLRAEEQQLAAVGDWEYVTLPHTAMVEDYVIREPWQGVCYYRRSLHITAAEARRQHWIEFEGAMQLADVWINGQHARQHAGGFTSFVVDATDLLHVGDNELVVRLDNRDNPLIPPGKPLNTLDFCYHSGLYRDVWLISKGDLHITHPLLADRVAGGGVFVTYPRVGRDEAEVRVQTEVANTGAQAARVTLRQTLLAWQDGKAGRRAVAAGEQTLQLAPGSRQTDVQQLTVKSPRLWHPESPHLYVLRTEVVCDGRVVDSEETRIGIRRFEITDEGCFVNGIRVELDGSNRHQEYPYVGNAIPDRAQYRDVWQIRDNGFNIVRLGHYPQDPSLLDACDRLGLLAIEPIPGWQFFNKDSLFVALSYESVREMIRRDRNHPSILLWETTLNESWPPAWWKDSAVAVAHAEMPGDQCFTAGDSYGYSGFDVCYNDWDDATFSRPNNSRKPAFIREYYDYEFGGHYSSSRVTRGDGERALRQNLWNAQWSHNSNRTHSRRTLGGAVWSMYDYNRGCCDNICYSGVADLFRRPKYSLQYYRSQTPVGAYTPAGPRRAEVFVASRWDEASSDTVVVLGNVAEVALLVNGREVARQRPDSGPTTAYTPQTNAGNCAALSAPPFTFCGIRFEAGELCAVGYDAQGKAVARHAVRTPGPARQLRLSYFESGQPAGEEDLLIVYATLTDDKGTPCHTNGVAVSLSVEGADVVGPTTTQTEDGVASFLVHTHHRRKVKLQAVSGAMQARMRWKLK